MTRDEYKALSQSTRDNGHHYTISHADEAMRADLQRLHEIGRALDHLLERQRWMNNPDTTPANIIRLTTPQE